jgi:CO/xanthine dehydrogenase Mo-binding subunit
VSGRIDGWVKVTGAKVYGADMRPVDQRWSDTRMLHALYVRAGAVGKLVQVDPSRLPDELTPKLVVLADSLDAAKLSKLSAGPPRWMLAPGDAALHPGQPVALLYFDDICRWRDAVAWLRSGGAIHTIAADGPLPEFDIRRLASPLLSSIERERPGSYGRATTYVRHDAAGFSRHQVGDHNVLAVSAAAEPDATQRDRNRRARAEWQSIEAMIASEGWRVVERTFTTPTNDPMFMELESGLAWWDGSNRNLRIVAGTQSPLKDRKNLVTTFKNMPLVQLKADMVDLVALSPGGGFGGRDDSTFAVYLGIAAMFAPSPVRLAFDRFEQFLVGIKRHASTVTQRLAFDSSGSFQALISAITLDGGGEANLTGAVVGLSALHAAGPYAISRSVIVSEGLKTPGAPAGSMRGFGIPQVCLAMECVVDEAAAELQLDAIELRRKNALQTGGLDVRGTTLIHDLANLRLLEAAAAEPLWRGRDAERKKRSIDGVIAWGVGFAMCMEAYGTTSDAAVGGIELDAAGALCVRSSAVDMGQGAATAVAEATRRVLGRPADRVDLESIARFDAILSAATALGAKDANAMSASMSAFHKVHAVEMAARLLRSWTLEPAARALLGVDAKAVVTFDETGAHVDDKVLSLAELAAHAHASGLVVEVQAHTFFQQQFSVADFVLEGMPPQRLSADLAFARRHGDEVLAEVPRENLVRPSDADRKTARTLYASAAHLVGVEVNLRSGVMRVTDAVCLIDAGKVLHEPLLRGQVEGGFAMGLGMAMLEEVPPYPFGVDGFVNLHRYQVPRLRHMPPAEQFQVRLIELPGDSVLAAGIEARPHKGIAEACMTTVPPAVLNAVAHATGYRFHTVPLTPARFLEAVSR